MLAEAAPIRTLLSALVAIAVLGLLVPAWHWTSADRLADHAPTKALVHVPSHPRALEVVSARAFEAGDDPRAIALAKAAIGARPLEARPYRVLAASYERSGRLADAHAAHLAAIAVAPSDAVSRLWIASRLLADARFAESLGHIDRALRARPDLAETVFPVLARGVGDEDFVAALVAVLGGNPPWRSAFLAHVVGSIEQVDPVLPLFRALAEKQPLSDTEVRLLISRFERDQRWLDVRSAWDATVGQGVGGTPDVVDGGFEREPHGFGLGWRVSRIPGAIIGFAPARGSEHGGRALTVRFLDQRVPFANVQQLLLLPEGRYRLSGEARLDALRARRGLRWDVICFGQSQPIGRSPPLVGSSPWQAWGIEFVVPESCPAQWLVLRIDAIGPSEQLVGGGIAVDGMRLGRIGEESPD